jgi:AhpD family alkylhydroperoxidase
MTAPTLDFAAFQAASPEAVAALRALSAEASQGLDKGLVELIKVRASQINGCAYCAKLHSDWARRDGVPQAKLDLVAVWREAPLFDTREQAALAWMEALCAPGDHAAVSDARDWVSTVFSPDEVLRLTLAAAAINAWNRIAGPLGFPPP